MRIQTGLIALAFAALGAGTLEAQLGGRTDPRDRRPSDRTGGTIGDIIFGNDRVDTRECRVRDAVTPDGRVVQICDNRRDDDPAYENRRDGRGRRGHVNDRDGDGDFDARDRAIRKREHEIAKARAKRLKESRKAQRADD